VNTPRRKRRHFAPVCALLAVAACGGGTTGPRTPTKLEIVGGANQTGPIGASLADKIIVRASDGEGPLEGVVVTVSTGGQGGGSASPATATTGATGEAQVTWTLGSTIGTQTLTFTTTGVAPVSVTAIGTVGTASLIVPASDQFQLTVVSHPVSIVPRVKVTDLFGNPISGITVTFEAEGGGSVTGASPTTGADGSASVGSWTIGPDVVDYTLRARIVGGTVATFQARGIPATFTIAEGNGQSANAGTALPIAPAVRAGRDDGTPISGALVTFTVTGGGGVVHGASVSTGTDGIARPTRWILGTTPGANSLEASIVGKNPLVFQATGVAAVPASAVAGSPVAQNAFFGNFVQSTPSITVTDASGNPVAGVPITFQISQGDGQLTGPNQVTGFDGQARLSAWRLGSAVGHTVQATSAAMPPVSFNATASAVPPSTFTIEVRFITTPPNQVPTPAQQAAFDQAVARWREVLISGDAPYPVNESATSCFPAMNETVPGVVIFAKLATIDGAGGILGQAGPCIVRDDPEYLSAVGVMQFDVADLALLESTSRLNPVILHEMAHVLGFGTLWSFLSNSFLTGRGGGDPFFNGSSARGAFLAAATIGTTFTGNPVPVENSGGSGTRDSHWRESIVTNELMTGFISAPGVPNPLSAFTAASFRDIGYVVNDAVAEPFTFQAALQSMLAGPGFQLQEGRLTEPILVIDRRGRVVRRVQRQ
jgi:leishmanolysin/Big-like domain-containing protein